MFIDRLLILALFAVATPVAAEVVAIGGDRYAVTLRMFDRNPQTLAAAHRAVARIESAAMAACGVSGSALREVERAVRRSGCWRDSMAHARRQIDNPLLLQVWEQRY